MAQRAPASSRDAPLLAIALLLLLLADATNSAVVTATAKDTTPPPECSLSLLRALYNGVGARDCARDAGVGSPFNLLRAPPTAPQLLAMCRSSACTAFFHEQVPRDASSSSSNGDSNDCIMPVGAKMQLFRDLVTVVRTRCIDFSDAYVLVDCIAADVRNSSSEIWYFADSANISTVPERAQRLQVTSGGGVSSTAVVSTVAQWEGDEVIASSKSVDVYAYIEDTARREAPGRFVGVLDAARRGMSRAYECSRADDAAFSTSSSAQCEQRYFCVDARY